MTTRRSFLRQSALGTAALSLAAEFAFPQERSPAERIRIGHIGLGGQGLANLKPHLKNTVALCDVDTVRLGKAKETVEKGGVKDCKIYSDFRKMLDDKDIDAVVISTPDHWHALPAILACEAGKDVYCEKPLTLSIAEGRALVKVARRTKRIVQTGSQQRSDAKFRQACELVRNGKLGKIKTIKVSIPTVNFKGPAVPDSPAPKELDYDLWLGPAPLRPYNTLRVHYNFRFFWDYSGGQLTNWGAHHLDIAQWALGMDESGPTTIEAESKYHEKKWYEVPESCKVTYQYANGVTLICSMGGRNGVTFEGDKGTLFVTRGKIEATPAELLKEKLDEKEIRLYVSANHHANWLDCIKSRKAPICEAEVGHRSATVCHLGSIAIRSGKKVTWDPQKEQIIGDPETAKMTDKEYRAPWKLPRE
jgi:predicted dehydrogenase